MKESDSKTSIEKVLTFFSKLCILNYQKIS